MVRETQEEIGVTPLKYQKRGQIVFDSYYKGEPALINVHIFTATEFDGVPTYPNSPIKITHGQGTLKHTKKT